MKKVAILIDGGHLRMLVRRHVSQRKYDPDYIEAVALSCLGRDEDLFRIFYYDCAPYVGQAVLPVSGETREFQGSDHWLHQLARKDLFAVRLGVLKFRGFKPKQIPIQPRQLTDDDFLPDFEQKGVDMRIGLDIATFCTTRAVDRIVLVTNDTDCVPAMKHGRIAGLQIVLVGFPGHRGAAELLAHSDYHRILDSWPA